MNDPLVSICCITYNHSRFIRDTIDGFLMQKTNFPFEVIIHDDASTDGTADVVRRYAAEHPDVILPILQTENQWSRGEDVSETFVWPRARGKYIALCEGDDFWVDPYKLQKEVDFLEAHPSCVMVATKIRCVNSEGADLLNNSILDNQARNTKRDISFFDLLEENCIFTLTTCIRADKLREASRNCPGYSYDYWHWLQLSCLGPIHKLDDVTAVYRVHPQGVSHQKGFFDKRYPLTLRDALLSYFSRGNTVAALSRQQRTIVLRSILRVLKARQVSFREKRRILSIALKNGGRFLLPLFDCVSGRRR